LHPAFSFGGSRYSRAMRKYFLPAFALLAIAPAAAQDMPGMDMPSNAMPGMDMSGDAAMDMNKAALGAYPMTREASGTSWQPDAAPSAGIMQMTHDWMVMLQGRAAGILDSQSGPRGGSMGYESAMAMAMATRQFTQADTLGLRAMISLDPFIGRRGYPLLLASGETANGATPLVDPPASARPADGAGRHLQPQFQQHRQRLCVCRRSRRTGAGSHRLHASPVRAG
jgi:hypothetical protein